LAMVKAANSRLGCFYSSDGTLLPSVSYYSYVYKQKGLNMNGDNPLFTENEHFTDVAMQIDTEAACALRPIIKKFLAEGYNIREICHVLIHNAAALEHEFVLEAQWKAAKEKRNVGSETKTAN